MENLHSCFEASLKRMGIPDLGRPIYGSAPAAVRFAIGGDEKIYLGDHRKPNGAYIENAVDRALALYDALPGTPDLLRIDGCPGLSLLPPPDQQQGESAYWNIEKGLPCLRKLLREIVRSELDPAGLEDLMDSVYFLDSYRDVLYHLYDDRGCDVAAADEHLLTPLRDRFPTL